MPKGKRPRPPAPWASTPEIGTESVQTRRPAPTAGGTRRKHGQGLGDPGIGLETGPTASSGWYSAGSKRQRVAPGADGDQAGKEARHQKCSCCRRNSHMKDNYEREGTTHGGTETVPVQENG